METNSRCNCSHCFCKSSVLLWILLFSTQLPIYSEIWLLPFLFMATFHPNRFLLMQFQHIVPDLSRYIWKLWNVKQGVPISIFDFLFFKSNCYEWLKCATKCRSPCDFTCMYLTCKLVSQLCSVFPFMLAVKLSNPNPGVSQLAGPFTTPPLGHMT